MAIKVYVVAGGPSVGKSSVIRNVMNIKKQKIIKNFSTKNGIIDIFCKVVSLQEDKINSPNVQNYINQKTSGRTYSAILVALRTNVCNGMPIAEDYLHEFVNNFKWQIECVAELTNNNTSTLHAYCKKNNHQYQNFQPLSQSLFASVKTFFKF